MHGSRPLLFAQREGRVLEVLGSALPPRWWSGARSPEAQLIDTPLLPALHHDDDLAAYGHLRRMLRRAVTDVGHRPARPGQHRQRPPAPTRPAAPGVPGPHRHRRQHGCRRRDEDRPQRQRLRRRPLRPPHLPGLHHRLRRCTCALDREGITPTRTFTTFASHTSEEFRGPNTSRKPSAART
ncbi:hypothetical protein LV779_35070 [Streptomyces thinghirensis]|nr:hypothetical protein [Streptomyces thinghirensis]